MNVGNTIKHKHTDKVFTVENISASCVTLKDSSGQLHYITPKGAAAYFEILNLKSEIL